MKREVFSNKTNVEKLPLPHVLDLDGNIVQVPHFAYLVSKAEPYEKKVLVTERNMTLIFSFY